jgi:drug/metabolite transporter (DMT)-like permease
LHRRGGALTPELRGLLYGFVGVASFSLTLPATRVAVRTLDPVVVGVGRALVAAAIAAVVLVVTRQRPPPARLAARLMVVAGGVIFGFPVLSAWAMQHVPAAHGAVVIGILPLATALAAALLAGERPPALFWASSLFGSGVVAAFALHEGGGGWEAADWALVGAVVAAAVGYAEGARLARTLGGWQVISWTLVLASPAALAVVWPYLDVRLLQAPGEAWLAFGYVALVSQYLGFFAWYAGLALGGIARVGQVQLLQPFLTLLASAALLGEPVTGFTLVAAALVVAAVAVGRKA